MTEKIHEAVLWEAGEGGAVQCTLCNFRCRIAEGKTGVCKVRKNIEGKLYSLNYHCVCASGIDPIEKKPLFHFQPGRQSFSIATQGCNFKCDFCQNWRISQYPRKHDSLSGQSYAPGEIVAAAYQNGCSSISYTYTEPTIFMELAADCGRLARKKGIANVFVSNGYMTCEAVDYARDFLDAINVDLKAFNPEFYQKVCRAKLEPVLETLRYIVHHTDIWLEITTLIVPGLNDYEDELIRIAEFISKELGPHVPWHISRYHPDFERTDGQATSVQTLEKAWEIGKNAGLHYIYIGNMPGAEQESTFCHECGQLLIERVGYRIRQFNAINGACPDCGNALAGVGLEPISF